MKCFNYSCKATPCLVFRIRKTYVDQSPKPQVGSNWPKSPPPPTPFLPFGEILGLHLSHDVTLPKHISHIIEHLIGDLAEKYPPPPPSSWTENFLDWIYPSHAISSNFGSAGRKVPPPPVVRLKILDWIYPFHAISSNFGLAGRKAPLPLFSTFS